MQMLNIYYFFENYMIEVELIFVFNNCKYERQNLSLAFISSCMFTTTGSSVFSIV
jgi:hypothetical protein